MGRIAWVSASVVLVLAVLAFASGRGFSLSASEGGPSVKVDAPLGGQVSQEQVDRSQGDLEAEIARANEQLEQETSVASVRIAGDWFVGSLPGSYVIEQVGTAATITEFDGFGNITAVGQGTLIGSSFTFDYVNAVGFSGFGELTLDPTGNFLSGFFEDDFGRRPAQLSRF